MSTILDPILNAISKHPTRSKLGLALMVYMAIVRSLRYRRINSLLKKYQDPTLPFRDLDAAREISAAVIKYEHPYLSSTSLEFALFKTYAIPTISKILASTREFTDNALKRSDDTAFILLEMAERTARKQYREKESGGIVDEKEDENDKLREEIAVQKLNFIHGHYNIKQEDYLYTLALFVLEPPKWINRFEWRKMTELEKNALLAIWIYNGERMYIENIPRTIKELEEWTEEYESKHMVYAKSNGIVAESTTGLLLSRAPRFMHSFVRNVISSLLTDRIRTAFGIPAPPVGLTPFVNSFLMIRGLFVRYFMLPRRYPMIRSALRGDPKNDNQYIPLWNKFGVTYPNGYKVQDLGPEKFIGKCPFTLKGIDNQSSSSSKDIMASKIGL
ncbi:hypothetical protein BGX27_010287 [Mortierella sp. AM989]|nr:hypothetical protein BGX27_010287 [Mortierella sp. AM989]